MEERCIADDCRKHAEKGKKFCHGHRAQEKQHRPIAPLREYGMSPGEYLRTKAIEYADAVDAKADIRRAWKRLHFATIRYVQRAYRQKVPKEPKTP